MRTAKRTLSTTPSGSRAPMVPSFHRAKEAAVAAFERGYVSMLLETTGGNVNRAAKMAGMDKSNFRKLVRRVS